MTDFLTISNLSIGFNGQRVIKDASVKIPLGEITGLIGLSGGGKSVLLKIIGQVLKADSGNIDYAGLSVDQINLMFQEGALFDSLSVFDNVAFPLADGRVPSSGLSIDKQKELAGKVLPVLNRVGLGAAYAKLPAQLSGGMKRRASLARALVSRPQLALLDDPTCGLDPIASSVIMDLIVELQNELQSTFVIASQDLRRLFPVVKGIITLFNGKAIYYPCLSDLIKNAPAEVLHFINCRYDINNEIPNAP